jgi:galactokinase
VNPADEARALLADLTGHEPDGVWSAPGRANLIGEHTDYNDGFVLPFAIDRRTVAAVRRRDDCPHADSTRRRRDARSLPARGPIIRVASTFDAGVVEIALADLVADEFPRDRVPEWAAYPLGVAWALLATADRPLELPGVDIALASDVPVGAGLSSSAAIEGATASALRDVWELELDAIALARIGRRAENEAVGAPTGIMDQTASMLGRRDAAIFIDCRTLEGTPVDLGFAAAGLEMLVIDTRVQHAHSTGGYGDRRAACERGAEVLGVPALRDLSTADLGRARELLDDTTFRRVRHVVTEDQRVLDTVHVLQEKGPLAIGDLLVASHVSLRDDFEVSCPELDTAVEAALAAGAVGARMTGGGFGGSAIALVAHADADAVAAAVARAFAQAGFTAPGVFTVQPSDGARRDS